MWLTIVDFKSRKTLKTLNDYQGSVPRKGELLIFSGSTEWNRVVEVYWMATTNDFPTLGCQILISPIADK